MLVNLLLRKLPVRWCCLAGLLLPAAALAQVDVQVEGDFPGLQRNADAFVGEVEGRTADGLRRYATHAAGQVREALRALGYYNPELEWEVTDEEPPRLQIAVEPGAPVLVRSRQVEIRGPAADDPEFAGPRDDALAVGDVLNHATYEDLRSAIQNRASRLGYFDGRFTSRRMEVDPLNNSADIRLIYESGERYTLGDVLFEDGHGFEEELLERFVQFEPGEPYHADKLARLNRDLNSSGYFSQVLVNANRDQAEEGRLPVSARLSPRDPRSVAAGVGFSTDVGPRVRGNWTEHWINRWGHRRGVDAEVSAPRQSLSGWYEIPLDPPMTDSYRLTGGYQREDIEDVESELLTFGQQWTHEMDSGWNRVLSTRWEGERFRIGGGETNTSSLLLPGLGFSRLVSDSPLDPSRGYRLRADVTGAHRSVLSDADILHLSAQARGLITVGNGHRFLARLQVGGVATNRFSDVPPSLRFFAGGDQSVRGYGYETLSPTDEDDISLGGRYLLVGSVEYQFPLTESWRLAAFVDEGNAIDDVSDPLATGVGVGVRWVSPVGPIRLDIAQGLDDEFGGGWRIHFSMGPEL